MPPVNTCSMMPAWQKVVAAPHRFLTCWVTGILPFALPRSKGSQSRIVFSWVWCFLILCSFPTWLPNGEYGVLSHQTPDELIQPQLEKFVLDAFAALVFGWC